MHVSIVKSLQKYLEFDSDLHIDLASPTLRLSRKVGECIFNKAVLKAFLAFLGTDDVPFCAEAGF